MRPWILSLSRAGTAIGLVSLTLVGCDTGSPELESQTTPVATAPDGGIVAPDASAPTPVGTAELRSGEVRIADFQGHYDGTQFVIDSVKPAAEPVEGFGLMSREQQLCVMNIIQDGVPGSGPANSVELVTESQARNAACPAPYDTVPSLCANVTLRSFYTDRTRTDVYVRINSLTTPLANPVLNSAVSTPGLPSGLGIFSYGNLGLAGSPEAAASRDWVFQTTGASFSFTGSVVTNMAELANGLDDDCDLRVDEGIANYANGIACVDNTDCTSTLCQGGICAPTTCSNGAPDAGETDLDCGGICGASCVGDKICTAGTDCVTGQCAGGFCLGSTGDVCAANLSCVNQVCNPNANLTSEVLTFAPEAVGPNATPITTDNTGAAFDDEAYTGAIPLGFGFNFFGNRYTNIYVSSNGWASFTAPTSSVFSRSAIPATGTPNNLIAMWWADLDPGDSGTVTYETTGSTPNRKFILNFDNVADYTSGGTPSTFQLVLTETTNTVDLHCTSCTNGGSVSRTQGIENATGTVGLATAGVNNANATKTNTSIRFNTVTQNGFCSAASCTDAVDNGNETGVDCGGLCGSNCADGITCNVGADCLRGNCTAGLCISCFDGIKNQTEGDTDCGGTCAVRCGSSQTCNITADCISGICDASNICVPTGDPGDACASDNDCDSRVCDAGGPGAQGGYPLNLNGLITAGTPVLDSFGGTFGDDEVSAAIPLGFNFPFYETTQTQVVIASNGWLTFGSSTSSFASTIPSTSTPNGIVSFFGRDLNPGAGGTITYATVGTAPNREFLVNYNNIPDYGGSDHSPVTVQVALQETTGYIDIRCVNCVSNTSTAIMGIENMAGTLGIPMPGAAYSAARNLTNTSIRFQTVTRVVGVCLAPTCSDVTSNQDESGIDCGGAVCTTRCAGGQACINGGDCSSTRCENAVCSTCTDGIKSGTETDIDCGGVCGSTCIDTKICSVNADCASNRCEGGICTSCTDGVANGTETDIDCGGICGGTCNFAETCSVNADCYTGNCAAGSCGKGATGANCGGGIDCDSQVCAPSIAKGVSDVATAYALVPTAGFTPVTFANSDDGTALLQIGFSFPFFTGTFTELSLSTNGLFAFGATASTTYSALLGSTATPDNFVTFFNRDLDAGLATITSGTVGTAPNRKFVIDIQNLEDYYFSIPEHDPISLQIQLNEGTGYIDLMYTTANSNAATVRIGAEGPSVGGAAPEFVALDGYNPGATAFTNTAVRIGTFNQYPGLCAAPNCRDATKNQGESGIDCGGECGATCAVGITCGTAADCDPGATGAAECLLVGTANICMNCGDGTKNGNEADVDCGGSCATDCVSGQTCGGNSDCDSNLCVGGLCAGCADATQNGTETDVDCGGADCGPCFGGKICTANADCLSGSCVGGFCALGATASSCSQGDQCLNGVCGGGTIPSANGVAVTWNPDASLNDVTAGARASSTIGGTSKLGDTTITPAIPLGFTFRYFDQLYTTARITGNGWLSFTAAFSSDNPPFLSPSTSSPNAVIAPFWFDANPSAGDANTDVRYLTTGTAPNRKFIVNWINVPSYYASTDKATFQVIIYENGGYVDINCKDCTVNYSQSKAQIVENAAGTQAFSAYSLNNSNTFSTPNQTAKRYFTNATNGASCVAPTCNDGVKNQGETDTDCGGAACGATCAPTKICAADTDCGGLGASCAGGFCRNCADGVLNGTETALDCGGQCGATCGGGLACNLGTDCATSGCTGGLCNLGATGELCTLGNQCANGVCSAPAPVAITTAPDAASLGNITAGTQATSFGSKLGDSGHSDAVTLPFAFNFFGTDYSSVKINGNGWISFDMASTNSHNAPTTSPSSFNPNAVIAGFWFDAEATISASSDVRYTTVGTAPNRKFIVNYVALPYWLDASDTVTFQIALNEGENTVDIFCADCTLATTGTTKAQILENGTGTVARSAYSLSASSSFSIPNNTGYRYNTGSIKACQAPTATDGVKNGTETDVDCGGTSGTLCASNKICIADTDCGGANATCAGGLCRNCSDTVKNGNETDIDCGGICGGNCGFNEICALSGDCASANCVSGLCGLSADGLACSANGDCASSSCDGVAGGRILSAVNQVGTYNDGLGTSLTGDDSSVAVQLGFKFQFFGNEFSTATLSTNGYLVFSGSVTGYGSNLPTSAAPNNLVALWWNDLNSTAAGQIRFYTTGVAPFRKFVVNYNGLNHYFSGNLINAQMVLHESLNYVDLTCINCAVDGDVHYQGVENATGTSSFTTETNGASSSAITNRTVRYVTGASSPICAPATCGDGTLNGTETGIDCGGSCRSDCTKNVACVAGTDCLSGSCISGLCAGIADAGACTLSNSCTSGVCTAGACAAPTCTDTVKNGAETGADCGGGTCGTCAAGLTCSVAADCTSTRCDGGLCRTCTDGVQSGSESDIDCGGVCVSGSAGKCALTKICTVNGDCGSGNCVAGVCAAPVFDCFNGIQDVNETGVDCGGSDCAAKCLIGVACSLSSDCASGTCTGGVCAKAADAGSCYSGADCNSGVCGGASAPTATAASYSYTDPTVGTGWTTVAGIAADDAIDTTIFTGTFNFRLPSTLGGSQFNSYTVASATSNGWFGFGSSTGLLATTYTLTLPSATIRPIIGLYAADSGSSTTANNGVMRYKTFGTAPYRKYVYDVTNHPGTYNSTPSFTAQVVLYETTNQIEILCKNCANTNAHTQGFNPAWGANPAFITGRNNAAFTANNDAVAINPAPGLSCQAPTNTDGVKNGTETDVDCGGSSGKLCGFNLICAAGSDCKSAECNSGLCAKSTTGEACTTGVDCLGANCAANVCGVGGGGASCLVNSDCASVNCASGICGKLAVGASCGVNGDCQSDYCLSGAGTDTQPGVYAATYAAIDATKPACTTANCLTLGDAKSGNLTLPFTFKFFDVDYTSFFISENGYISFDTSEFNSHNALSIALPAIPSAGAHGAVSPGPAIFAYMMDTNAGANQVRWWTEGTAPNRRVIIAYSAVPHYNGAASGGTFTGQIILNETSNTVEVQIESGSQGTTVAARTRGVRNADGTRGFYYQGSTHLDSENLRAFPATASSSFLNSRRLYRTNTASGLCAAAGSRGAACVSNAGCLSGACVTSGVATALAAPGATPPADFQTSAVPALSSSVFTTSQTASYATATGVTLPMPIGFPYKFYGRTYTDVRGAATGYLSFLTTTTSSATFANLESATTTSQNGLIAYWWRSMGAFTVSNNASFKTTGTAPFRVFTYDVNGLTSATALPVKARVQLYESTGIIDVSCYNCSANGGTVSNSAQGIESVDGNAMGIPARVLTTAAGGTNAAQNNTAYRFNTGTAAVCF